MEQPVRTPTGMGYGEAGALEQSQQSAPMQAGGQPGGGGRPIPGMTGGVFGPTQHPDQGPGMDPNAPMANVVQDPDALLREMYRAFPHPDLERMLLRRRPRR